MSVVRDRSEYQAVLDELYADLNRARGKLQEVRANLAAWSGTHRH